MAYVRYCEGWVRTGHGQRQHRAELIHVHMLGERDDVGPVGACGRDPVSLFHAVSGAGAGHRIFGQADMVMDLQKIESRVMRATLD